MSPADWPPERHEHFLRRAIEVARAARAGGNHPFGAILVDQHGKVLLEAGNASRSSDRTAHAERALMSQASSLYDAATLANCVLYTSAEPCAMCAGAAYWAGVGGVVYGVSEAYLKALIGPHPENLTMALECRRVFGAGQRPVWVIGPLLEAESRAVHEGFWK